MPYPEHLIPSLKKLEIFTYCKECYLCRWTKEKNELFDEDGNINQSYISVKDIEPNLSTNIICCPEKHKLSSKIEDILIVIENKELTKTFWDYKELNIIELNDFVYRYDENRGYFFLKISRIHEQIDTYPKNIKNKTVQFKFQILVKHRPTVINFFHFQIEFFEFQHDGQLKHIPKFQGQWGDVISNKIRNLIIDYCENSPKWD